MPISKVDICNLALAHLGKPPIATDTEESTERRMCFRFYDQALHELLSRSNWSFAQKIAALAERPPEDNLYSVRYRYWYDLPNDLLSPVRLVTPVDDVPVGADGLPYPVERRTDTTRYDYTLLGGNLFTNVKNARLLYVYNLQDPTRFSPLFRSALAFLIARYAAIPLTRSERVAASVERAAEVMLYRAAAADAAGEPNTYIRQPDVFEDRYFDVPGVGGDV